MTSQAEYNRRVSDAWRHDRERKKGEIVPDGHGIKVPVMVSDAKKPAPTTQRPAFRHSDHRPRSIALTDEQKKAKEASYAARDKRLSDAWKGSPQEDDDNG